MAVHILYIHVRDASNYVLRIANLFSLKCRIVKLSSPKLNYFIIAGAVFMYCSVYIHLIPSTDEVVNQVRCVVSASFMPTIARNFQGY